MPGAPRDTYPIRRILGARRTSSSLLFALPLVGLVVVTAALAVSMRSAPGPVAVPPEFVPALATLCGDLRADPLRPELAERFSSYPVP